jgi:hypothetical protein
VLYSALNKQVKYCKMQIGCCDSFMLYVWVGYYLHEPVSALTLAGHGDLLIFLDF